MKDFFWDFDARAYERDELRRELGCTRRPLRRCPECGMLYTHVDDCPEREDDR